MLTQPRAASSLLKTPVWRGDSPPTAQRHYSITNFREQTLWPETCDEDVPVLRKLEVDRFLGGSGEYHRLVPTMRDLPTLPCHWVCLLWSFCSFQVMPQAAKAAGICLRRMSPTLTCALSLQVCGTQPRAQEHPGKVPPSSDGCMLFSLPLGHTRNHLFSPL